MPGVLILSHCAGSVAEALTTSNATKKWRMDHPSRNRISYYYTMGARRLFPSEAGAADLHLQQFDRRAVWAAGSVSAPPPFAGPAPFRTRAGARSDRRGSQRDR